MTLSGDVVLSLWNVMPWIPHHTIKCGYVIQENAKATPDTYPESEPFVLNNNTTTNCLTATN